jgi:hypothetical protein
MSRRANFFNIRDIIGDNPILKLTDTREYSNGIEYKNTKFASVRKFLHGV